MTENPRISFVISARNSEHDNMFLARLRTVLRLLDTFVARHHLSCEFVIVQYNPPSNKPLLETALADLPIHAFPIRIITVPKSFHTRIAPPNRKGPFLEYVAKNIGIRRALGEFILATNLDIVFSDAMVARLVQPLMPDTVYQVHCHDLSIHEIRDFVDADEALKICHMNTTRIWTEWGLFYVSWSRWLKRFLRKPKPRNLFMAPLFNPIKKWMGPRPIKDVAPGHFTLAHRDAWNKVRGYDQQKFTDVDLDSYNVGVFACHGFQQIVLPQPIFHINHIHNPLRQLPDGKLEREMKAMAKTGKPYTVYSENWGYPDEQFAEQQIT